MVKSGIIYGMKIFSLSPEETQELHAAWLSAKQEKDVKASYKIHALILYGSDMTRDEVFKSAFYGC